jgi:hypothetical protein
MKLLKALVMTTFLLCGSAGYAQDPDKASGTVTLNQDVFFGFYPTFAGAYELNDKIDATYYGIIWTTPSFGTGGGGGLWTEFGGGVNFKAADGALTIKPQVGFLNGKLLSNGNFPMALEGWVPNITANVNTSRVEGELYAGWYLAWRKGQVPNEAGTGLIDAATQNNFVHWWANGGVKMTKMLSVGLHYENLYFHPSGAVAGDGSHLYKWLGPYVQAALPNNMTARFTAGANVTDRPDTDGNDNFYKLSIAYSF